MAAWKSFESWSSWFRRRLSTGVRSPPPPNQPFDVTTMRVFICPVGALGLVGWAMNDMPDAQKRGSSSAPGICLANSGGNSPCTVEVWQPTFSNTRPDISDITPPPPFSRVQALRVKCPGAMPSQPGKPSAVSSTASSVVNMLSRKVSNQSRARSLFASKSPVGEPPAPDCWSVFISIGFLVAAPCVRLCYP